MAEQTTLSTIVNSFKSIPRKWDLPIIYTGLAALTIVYAVATPEVRSYIGPKIYGVYSSIYDFSKPMLMPGQ